MYIRGAKEKHGMSFTAEHARKIAEEAEITEATKKRREDCWQSAEAEILKKAIIGHTTALIVVNDAALHCIVGNLVRRGFLIVNVSYSKSTDEHYILVDFSRKHYCPSESNDDGDDGGRRKNNNNNDYPGELTK